jgi:drug/metabolite transporter (DMT)-like permease
MRRRSSFAMRTSALIAADGADLRAAEKLLSIFMSEQSNDTPGVAITLRAIWNGFFGQFAGLGAAWLGVLCFSLTVPATRVAVPELGPLLVGAGRSVIAGGLSLLVLAVKRERLPAVADLRSLTLVALGVVFGFPLCSAIALRSVPAVHALVIIGLVPMVTAILAVLRNGERPSSKFWLASSLGALSVVAFGFSQARFHWAAADGWMLAAVVCAAFGYSEGARLTPRLGGWRVISWALVLSLPFSLGLSVWAVSTEPLHAAISWRAWLGLGYVGVVSMYLGFFAWYRGLTRTSIARASQVQLAQPVLGFLWSWLLLGERVSPAMLSTAGFVLACAAWASRSRTPPPQIATLKRTSAAGGHAAARIS